MKKIIIGARGSKLSLAYVSRVKSLILERSKDVDIHIKTIKTSGDIHQGIKLSEIGGKNLFCKDFGALCVKNLKCSPSISVIRGVPSGELGCFLSLCTKLSSFDSEFWSF